MALGKTLNWLTSVVVLLTVEIFFSYTYLAHLMYTKPILYWIIHWKVTEKTKNRSVLQWLTMLTVIFILKVRVWRHGKNIPSTAKKKPLCRSKPSAFYRSTQTFEKISVCPAFLHLLQVNYRHLIGVVSLGRCGKKSWVYTLSLGYLQS